MVRYLSAALLCTLAEAQDPDQMELCRHYNCLDNCLYPFDTGYKCNPYIDEIPTVKDCENVSTWNGFWCFDPSDLVKQHNSYRCMHNLPPLQWSRVLFSASDEWAYNLAKNETSGADPEPGFPAKMKAWGFDPNSAGQGVEKKGNLTETIDEWYNNKHGKVYNFMLKPSTTHFGCHVQESYERYRLVCDYGGPPDSAAGDDEVPAQVRNDCTDIMTQAAKTVLSPVVTQVFISYALPKKLAAAANRNPCIHEYRLVFADGLKLIAVDGDGPDAKPCGEFPPDIDMYWEVSKTAIFSKKNDAAGGKFCLKADWSPQLTGPFNLVANDLPYSPCTNNNMAGKDLLWNFAQTNVGGNLCMLDIHDADGENLVIDANIHPFQAGNVAQIQQQCSSRWNMQEVFKAAPMEVPHPHAHQVRQPALLQDAAPVLCSHCLSSEGPGNFSCATDSGCMLYPTELDCTSQRGKWCATPPSFKDQVCEGDDWEGHSSARRVCSAGCVSSICQQKIVAHPKTAIKHCYTKAQFIDGDLTGVPRGLPRGCNFGSPENTCALDDKDVCVYSGLGFAVNV